MRGRTALGVTFLVVIDDYVARLERSGGRLFISGLDPKARELLDADGRLAGRSVQFFGAELTVGGSSLAAFAAARQWLDES